MRSIESILKKEFVRLYPTNEVSVRVLPIVDHRIGHCGTDICQKIAAQRKEDPRIIAEIALRALAEREPTITAHFDSGFLNFTCSSTTLGLLKIDNDRKVTHPAILCVPNVASIPVANYMRCFGFALSHAILTQYVCGEVAVQFIDTIERYDTQETLLAAARQHVERVEGGEVVSVSQAAALETVRSFLSEHQPHHDRLSIWLTPDTLERKAYSKLYREAHSKIQFHCPAQKILAQTPLQGVFESFKQDVLASALYALQPCDGSDIDWLVPTLQENTNIVWFAESQVQRILQQGVQQHKKDVFDQVVSSGMLDVSGMEVLVRSCQMQRFLLAAVEYGLVSAWFSATHALLSSLNVYFNKPETRRKLHQGSMGKVEHEIVTGVLNVISDSISVWH